MIGSIRFLRSWVFPASLHARHCFQFFLFSLGEGCHLVLSRDTAKVRGYCAGPSRNCWQQEGPACSEGTASFRPQGPAGGTCALTLPAVVTAPARPLRPHRPRPLLTCSLSQFLSLRLPGPLLLRGDVETLCGEWRLVYMTRLSVGQGS